MTPDDEGHVAGALLGAAYARTRQEARGWLDVAVLRGLPLATAGDLLKRWDASNQPQTIGGTR
jgi:hypothetical protein